MFVLVSYDISADKRRNKMARALEGYGTRVQYSVFEVNLEPRQVAKMRDELSGIADVEADSIRLYTLCRACYEKVEVLGKGRAVERPAEAIII